MKEISYDLQLKEAELDVQDNWKEDPRDRFIRLFKPLTDDSEYYFKHNTTDSSGKLLELYKNGEDRRVLLFKGKQDMTIGAAFNGEFYQFIKQTVDLPDNRLPNKSQPHVNMSLKMLWDVICAATGKTQYMGA